MIKPALGNLSATGLRPLGLSLPRLGTDLNRLLTTPSGLRPHRVRDFLESQLAPLRDIETHGASIEDRGLAASWRRCPATFDRLLPMLRETAPAPRELDDLWSPSTLEAIDHDIQALLQKHPHCADLLADDAQRWWRLGPLSHALPHQQLTRDEMRALVMHTHARHPFFELHGFAQRVQRAGLADLSAWFAPNLIGLRAAHDKLALHGLGTHRTLRKGLHDGAETDALIHRLRHHGALYMPMGSWGDTTYSFVEKNGYSCVLESEVPAVDVTLFGSAFLSHAPSTAYKEYLVMDGLMVLGQVEQAFTRGGGLHPAFGKPFDVYQLKRLSGDFVSH